MLVYRPRPVAQGRGLESFARVRGERESEDAKSAHKAAVHAGAGSGGAGLFDKEGGVMFESVFGQYSEFVIFLLMVLVFALADRLSK